MCLYVRGTERPADSKLYLCVWFHQIVDTVFYFNALNTKGGPGLLKTVSFAIFVFNNSISYRLIVTAVFKKMNFLGNPYKGGRDRDQGSMMTQQRTAANKTFQVSNRSEASWRSGTSYCARV